MRWHDSLRAAISVRTCSNSTVTASGEPTAPSNPKVVAVEGGVASYPAVRFVSHDITIVKKLWHAQLAAIIGRTTAGATSSRPSQPTNQTTRVPRTDSHPSRHVRTYGGAMRRNL